MKLSGVLLTRGSCSSLLTPLPYALALLLCTQAHAQFYEVDAFCFVPAPYDLIEYVSAHMNVKLPDNLQIGAIDNNSPVLSYAPDWSHGIKVRAPAVEFSGRIYMPVQTFVHMQEEEYKAIIVHELAHVAQDQSKKVFPCNDQREAEAFELQNNYLTLRGLPPAIGEDALADLKNCENVKNSAGQSPQ